MSKPQLDPPLSTPPHLFGWGGGVQVREGRKDNIVRHRERAGQTKGEGFAMLRWGEGRFCHGSVDTPTTGVDIGFETLRQNVEEKVKCVDTASSGVDTSSSSQRTQLTGLYCVSTQPQVESTLDPVPRRPTRAMSFLKEGKKSGKEASASRGAEQRRQGEKKEKKKEKKRRG
ncbi:hypothetical protein Taro_000154 [Colocasia esculenta]|uniref:Uncharacterized protein n=1 Tax=Colocasia esculenta TaxID=4460 RepID=A0A843T713_COLES|nr:hypothetical protein [Colocasia esculenta]